MRQPRLGEVYMYQRSPCIVYKTGSTWIHRHPYIEIYQPGLFDTYKKLMYHEWDKLTPIITNEGDYKYHSFRFKQHKLNKKELRQDD